MRALSIFLSIFTLLFCLSPVHAQNFTLQLQEKLTIGEEVSDSTEYLFANIRDIRPLKDEQLLVANGADNSLRIFNMNGRFIRKFGGRGRGPGEFHEISSIEITQDNRILLIDRYQNRVTIFSNTGEFLDTIGLPISNMTNAQFILQREGGGSFFIGYRDFYNPEDQGHYLHLFDENIEQELSRHLNIFDHFFDSSIHAEVRMSQVPRYYSVRFGAQQIGFTTSIYTGIVASLDERNLNERRFGQPLSYFYELYDWEDRRVHFDSNQRGFMSISGQGNNYLIKRKGATLGLIGNRDFLLHFYALFQDEETIPYVHIYSSHGTLLRTISLNKTGISFIKNGKIRSVKPLYLDENNRLYVADNYYKGSYPAVRIFETNLEELLEEN